MKPLAPLKRGPKILRAWLNRLLAAVLSWRIVRGVGYEVNEHPGGSQLVIDFTTLAAATAARRLFQIYDASTRDDGGAITAAKVRLVSSLLAGSVPSTGIDAGITVASGDKIYARVAFSTSTGAVTSRTIAAASSVPADSSGVVHLQIGSVVIAGDVLTATNDVYGPIEGCRVWFADPLNYALHGSPA